MINNEELPVGFMMELARHSDIMIRFSRLPENEQNVVIEKARHVSSRNEMRNLVENMFREHFF